MSRLGLLALLMAAGCTVPEKPPDPLAGIAPHPLAVSSIDVGDAFPPDIAGSFLDKRHSSDLVAATRAYLTTRLVPAGTGMARATVEAAQLVAEPRQTSGDLKAAVTRQPDSVLHGKLAVRLARIGADGLEKGSASASVERSRTVLQYTSVLERDRLAQTMIHDLIADLDQALLRSIQQNLPELTPR